MQKYMEQYNKLADKMKKLFLLIQAVIHFYRHQNRFSQTGNVLVVSDGFMGDGLLKAHSVIKKLQENYKTVTLICSPAEWMAYKLVLDTAQIRGIQYNSKYDFGYSNLENVVEKSVTDVNYDCAITLSERNSLWMTYIIMKVQARRRITLFYRGIPKRSYNRVKYLFLKSIVDKSLPHIDDAWKMIANKKLIKELGLKEDKTKIVRIPVQCNYTFPANNYITLSVDSSNKTRRWNLDKYICLIKTLLHKYEYNIILLGNNVSDYELEQYKSEFIDIPRVKNYIDKTDIKEFVELIRNSHFHIGVDSGSIHIAASVGTLAFCLTGKWDGKRVFPYCIEESTEGTTEPICIFRRDVNKLPCYGCAYKGIYGWGNRECRNRCKAGQNCLCLEQIQVDDVIKEIDQTIRKKL